MIFHLVPKLYNPYTNITNVKILSVSIPDFGIEIPESHLNQGKPFPNKNYYVGMLKAGKKATHGILIDLNELNINSFTAIIKWSIELNNETLHLEHKIINHIEDSDLENGVISHNAILWYADKNFDSKWSKEHLGQPPVDFEPKLNLEKYGLVDQENEIHLPVLELERLQKHVGLTDRMPTTTWLKPSN